MSVTPPHPAPAPPCTIVIFGAAGDLTKRLLMPALYNLAGSALLADETTIVGLDHHDRDDDAWRSELSDALESFTKDASAEFHPDHIDQPTWEWIAKRLSYRVFDFEKAGDYDALATHLGSGNVLFYLAVGERFFGPIVEHLGRAGLLKETPAAFRRVAIEKPFGSDLASARSLNTSILAVGKEAQYYRVDHFLGKEPVQGILAMRFGNGIFEPMWRREHVDSVQITAAETIGIEGRGAFYDVTGALRDMVPNHLFSLLTMVAMEPPGSFDADDVRNAKAKLLEAIKPIAPHDAVRGQYAGYLAEDRVAHDSRTETYVALKVEIDNRRWSGVPFYLRTGKHLARHQTTIAIHFRPAPERLFAARPEHRPAPNVMTLGITPDAGALTAFNAKAPGPEMRLGPACMNFDYRAQFDEPPRVGYETLIYHALGGDQALFQRNDMIDAEWRAVQPLLDAWSTAPAPETYAPGSDGPDAAAALLERDGRRWLPL